MITLLKIVIGILLAFTAICLLCAVGIARSRDPVRIGRRRPPPADPFFHPFGEMPGFTAEQLARFAPPKYSGGRATPPAADGGSLSSSQAMPPSALSGSKRRAF
jgi:hypothetical protein